MFRFAIRDMLWLTALVAVAICWQMDRNRIARLADRIAAVEAHMTTADKNLEKTSNRLMSAEQRIIGLQMRTQQAKR